jgi:hypothetical protein
MSDATSEVRFSGKVQAVTSKIGALYPVLVAVQSYTKKVDREGSGKPRSAPTGVPRR